MKIPIHRIEVLQLGSERDDTHSTHPAKARLFCSVELVSVLERLGKFRSILKNAWKRRLAPGVTKTRVC